jgi:hypothetical protein
MPFHRRDRWLRRHSGGANSTNVIEACAKKLCARENHDQSKPNTETSVGMGSAGEKDSHGPIEPFL